MNPPACSPTTLVIFGATGDLSHRSLWPAIYNLAAENLLPEQFRVIGIAYDIDEQAFAADMAESVGAHSRSGFDPAVWKRIVDSLEVLRGGFAEDSLYVELAPMLHAAANDIGSDEVVFYLAVAPNFVAPIAKGLESIGYGKHFEHARLVCEKPFGHDLDSAVELNAELHRYFAERQIFRMDHYLGKETVQNLMVLRFANGIFEPLWNRNFVESVEITVAEPEGVGTRAGYYDPSGALRDVLQNHILQLVSFVAMEPPRYFDPESVGVEKTKVLAAGRIRDVITDVVRGQYVNGPAGCGYLQEQGIPAISKTETYVAVRLDIDNWRWAGTPFFLRTGKRLPSKLAEIVVRFKPAPHLPFASELDQKVKSNQLIVSLQPEEGVALTATAKVPGQTMELQGVALDFDYGSSFTSHSPQAYERLILNAMQADSTLFQHADEVEAAWRIVQPVLDYWAKDSFDLRPYPAGSDGPPEANHLRTPGRWRKLADRKHQPAAAAAVAVAAR
jgi:glucose-6-phosphate 1-dehydrogenase